jgi:hypothetical protein
VEVQRYSEDGVASVVFAQQDQEFDELLSILKRGSHHKTKNRYITTVENGATETLTVTILYSQYPCFRFILASGDTMSFRLSDYMYYENDDLFVIGNCNSAEIDAFLAGID